MRKLAIVGATVAVAVVLACVGASAAVAAPEGVWAVFAQCPTRTGGTEGCLYEAIEGGDLALGRTVVRISKTMVLQAGFGEEDEQGMWPLVAALNDETLTKVEQMLPGALFGAPVGVVPELAAPASSISLSLSANQGVTLPIKVRLVNPLLGAECSIGSNAHPIELSLTTGTSGGLTGKPGKLSTLGEGRILVESGISMVSSGFALPKAGGCRSAVVNEALNAILGLPTSKNTSAVFAMKMELTSARAVEEMEGG